MKKPVLTWFLILLVGATSARSGTVAQVVNVSTRSLVQTGDNVMIGGFIIAGTGPRTIVVRAVGPSLTGFGVPNALADPTLELHDSNSTLATNDNWQQTQLGGIITADQVGALQNSGLAPSQPAEPAIIVTLQPGNYTAIVSGKDASTGVGLVEVYDITQHFYVGNDNNPGVVRQYDLPITATSTPNFSIASNSVVTTATDVNGNLVVGDNAGNLTVFSAPLSGSSTPAAGFKNGNGTNNGQIAFTNTGDFFVSVVGTGTVNKFTHPFTNSSTPSTSITNPALTFVIGTALDFAQNLYVVNADANDAGNLFVYAPPYTGTPIITPVVAGAHYRKVIVGATQLFVCATTQFTGRVDVYNLPITSSSAPAFSITQGMNIPEAVALDCFGNLYVGNLGNSTVAVYNPPFSASSAPSTSLVMPASFNIFGISIGK
jgi:hypothetical protein